MDKQLPETGLNIWNECLSNCPIRFQVLIDVDNLNKNLDKIEEDIDSIRESHSLQIADLQKQLQEIFYLREEVLNFKSMLLENRKSIADVRKISQETWNRVFYNNSTESVLSQIKTATFIIKEQQDSLHRLSDHVEELSESCNNIGLQLHKEIKDIALQRQQFNLSRFISWLGFLSAIFAAMITLTPWVHQTFVAPPKHVKSVSVQVKTKKTI